MQVCMVDRDVAKAIDGEVCTKNKQCAVIILLKARIVKDGLAHLVKKCKMVGSPCWAEWESIILFHEIA